MWRNVSRRMSRDRRRSMRRMSGRSCRRREEGEEQERRWSHGFTEATVSSRFHRGDWVMLSHVKFERALSLTDGFTEATWSC